MSIDIAWFPDYGHLMAGIFNSNPVYTFLFVNEQKFGLVSGDEVKRPKSASFCLFLSKKTCMSPFQKFFSMGKQFKRIHSVAWNKNFKANAFLMSEQKYQKEAI